MNYKDAEAVLAEIHPAAKAVVEHIWEQTRLDYYASDNAKQKTHVFHDVCKLKAFTDR